MTDIIHQLRIRSGAIASVLLFVLMATWLSVLCPQCMANAAEAPPPASHCHSDETPTGNSPGGDHDCCDQVLSGPCLGASCAEFSAVSQAEMKIITPAGVQFDAVTTSSYDAIPQAPPELLHTSSPTPVAYRTCSLYLLHCSFLN